MTIQNCNVCGRTPSLEIEGNKLFICSPCIHHIDGPLCDIEAEAIAGWNAIIEADKNRTTKTVMDAILDFAKVNGYDGVCMDECGCTLQDFAPCGCSGTECEFGYVCNCEGCDKDLQDTCEYFEDVADGGGSYIVLSEKCEGRKRQDERESK